MKVFKRFAAVTLGTLSVVVAVDNLRLARKLWKDAGIEHSEVV